VSTYLLTWNPEHFSTGGDGSSEKVLNYSIGESVRWTSHSKQPRIGDDIYLMKIGAEPRGIVAKGTVTKESYNAPHWKDDTKQRSYIEFELQELRNSCEEGLLHILLLKKSFPEQKWSPQTSGIEIKAEYLKGLDSLWESGHKSHSLALYLSSSSNLESNEGTWYYSYKEAANKVKKIKNNKAISDEELKWLWLEKANGVASVGQGFMYKEELSKNSDFLRALTFSIINNPTSKEYINTLNLWKSESGLERNLWLVINRVFSISNPELYTSIVGKKFLKEIFKGLSLKFQIPMKYSDNWLKDNEILLLALKNYIPSDWDVFQRNIALWNLYDLFKKESDMTSENGIGDLDSSTNLAQNVIYYGPPGTGKTYKLQQLIQDRYVSNDTVLDESLWLNQHFEELNWFEVILLSVLDSGGEMSVSNIIDHPFFQAKTALNDRKSNIRQTAWAALQAHAISESTTVKYEKRTDPLVFEKTDNSRWFIMDESHEILDEYKALLSTLKEGPKHTKIINRFEFVTFHQSYGYEEFVEGLRPITNDVGEISYEVKPGIFKRICKRAESDPDNRYAIVIDEINRGNISKIFGELISLIEVDKRIGTKNALTVTLPYSENSFSVPSNLDIIGSMNTADRSLTHIDVALRRRFEFKELRTDYTLLSSNIEGINIQRMLFAINKRIELLLDREHILGHALLMKASSIDDLAKQFKTAILPLLEEYFFDDLEKISIIFNNNGLIKEQKHARNVWLGSADEHASKSFLINFACLNTADSYKGIYTGIDDSAFEGIG